MKSDLNSASAGDWRKATKDLVIRAYLPRELAWNNALMSVDASESGGKPRDRPHGHTRWPEPKASGIGDGRRA